MKHVQEPCRTVLAKAGDDTGRRINPAPTDVAFRLPQTEKYFARGFSTTIAEVDCSG